MSFSDMHKDLDDVFSKDYPLGALNFEIKQKNMKGGSPFDNSAMNGEMDFKLHTTHDACGNANKTEFTSAMNMSNGAKVTEKMNCCGAYSAKYEHKMGNMTYVSDMGLNLAEGLSMAALNNFSNEFKFANAKCNAAMKLSGNGIMPSNMNMNVVFPFGKNSVGADFNYDLSGQSAPTHHVQAKFGHGKGYACVGLKNANNIELMLRQDMNMKGMSPYPFSLIAGRINVDSMFLKLDHNMANSESGLECAWTGSHPFGSMKRSLNPMTGRMETSDKIKINDNIEATLACGMNVFDLKNGCNGFKGAKVGTTLNFTF